MNNFFTKLCLLLDDTSSLYEQAGTFMKNLQDVVNKQHFKILSLESTVEFLENDKRTTKVYIDELENEVHCLKKRLEQEKRRNM